MNIASLHLHVGLADVAVEVLNDVAVPGAVKLADRAVACAHLLLHGGVGGVGADRRRHEHHHHDEQQPVQLDNGQGMVYNVF